MKKLEGEAWLQSRQKRAIDIGVVSATSPLTVPLLGVSALGISAVDRVPPFFQQERTGLYPDTMKVTKLRTLRGAVDNRMSPSDRHHERATTIGKIARQFHFDEFPQLLDVFTGKMSIVGLRPIVVDELEETMDTLSPSEQLEWQWARGTAKPGLLSLYDVRRRGPAAHHTFRDRAGDDIEYAKTASFQADGHIMGLTARAGLFSALGIEISLPHRHVNTVGMMSKLAELFNVEVTPDDRAYWRSAVEFSLVVDDYVDDNTDTANQKDFQNLMHALVRGEVVGGIDEIGAKELGEVFSSLDSEKQAILLDCDLLTFSKRQASAADADAYLLSNFTESKVFADILSLPIKKDQADAPAREAFNNWLQLFSRAAYARDNFIDNKKDFESGRSPLEPGIQASVALGRAATVEMLRWMGETPLRAFPILARRAASNRLTRSLKH